MTLFFRRIVFPTITPPLLFPWLLGQKGKCGKPEGWEYFWVTHMLSEPYWPDGTQQGCLWWTWSDTADVPGETVSLQRHTPRTQTQWDGGGGVFKGKAVVTLWGLTFLVTWEPPRCRTSLPGQPREQVVVVEPTYSSHSWSEKPLSGFKM